ncbi:hypothetical protein CK203_016048 [Vitis vinifera]|uniref:Uncharacterized protein n=1 Tax=Vitis vinifera TaxID=29760 RepID=A0A438JN22_VITVI|nr:hypothetical protein CK203_016048 [Vitis vinifera]
MVSEHFRVLGSRACPLLVNAMLDLNDLGFAMWDVENSMLMSWVWCTTQIKVMAVTAYFDVMNSIEQKMNIYQDYDWKCAEESVKYKKLQYREFSSSYHQIRVCSLWRTEMLGGRMMTKTNYGVTTANKSHHKREMCVGSCMGSCKDRAKGTSSSLTIAWLFKQLPNHQKLKLREIQGIRNLLYSPRSS